LKSLFIFSLCFAISTLLGAYDFFAEDFVPPGEIYPMLLLIQEDQQLISAELQLSNPEGDVISQTQFFPYPLEGYPGLWVALLGLGPGIDPGMKVLDAQVELQDGQIYFRKRLMVTQRDFDIQFVKLDDKLTQIRSEPSPRKTQEYRQRWSVISSFNFEDVYHEEALTSPLTGDYIVTTPYGARRTYEYNDGSQSDTLHWGLDWAAPLGTAVYSVAAGRVRLAQEMLVTGNTLMIEHLPGVYSIYYHLDTLEVQQDQLVSAGMELGTMGESGLATGSHLHWEIRVSKVAVDPGYYLDHTLLDKEWIISRLNGTN
jgi:murein DD-endopeptidase MepM/ murein hydrolase activator NlpD